MGPAPVGKILLSAAAAACVVVAVAFLGVGIFVLLQSRLGMLGAALLTAVILLLAPALILLWKKPARPPPPRNSEAAILAAFAGMAREKPIVAVFAAGLFGLAEYFVRHRNKRSKPGVLL